MQPDHAKNLLAALEAITAPSMELPADATEAQKRERDLYDDGRSHLANAIDCMKRSIAAR